MQTLSAIVAFCLVLLVNATAQKNAITTLNSSLKKAEQNLVEIDGFTLSKAELNKLLSKINAGTQLSLTNITDDQLKPILVKLKTLQHISKLELTGFILPCSLTSNTSFTVDTVCLNQCDVSKGRGDLGLPPFKHLSFQSLTDTVILAVLQNKNDLKSVSINNCEINGKAIFNKLQESKLESLAVTECELEKFPFNIQKANTLKSLDISRNSIWLLDTTGVARLDVFKCAGNPLAGYLKERGIRNDNSISSDFTYKNAENQKYFRSDNPFVKPASETFNVAPQKFNINTTVPVKIVTKDAAKFLIPANCFVDANGNDVTGPVEVIVREYNDPLAVMIAGIPMFTDQKTKSDYLVSDGMFEIQAYSGDKKLEIKPGKQIDVEYPSINNLTAGNELWDLNPTTGAWNNISQPAGFSGAANATVNLTPAVKRFQKLRINNQTIKDTSDLNYRFNDVWHCGEMLIDSGLVGQKVSREEQYLKMGEQENFYMRGQLVGKDKEVMVRLVPVSRHGKIMYNNLKSINWIITDEISEEETEKLCGTNNYCDARYEVNSEKIVLKVKDEKGVHTYNVKPYSSSNSRSMMMRVQKSVKRTIVKADKYIANANPVQKHNIHTSYSQLTERKKYRMIKPFRNEAEKKMRFREFSRYAYPWTENGLFSNSVAYQFSLNKVGMKNIDCLHSLKNPKKMIAKTIDKDTITYSYVYQPSKNTVINFNGGYNENEVFAEANANTYIINMAGNEVSYTKLDKRTMSGLPDHESVCTTVKMPVEEFRLEEMDKKLEEIKLKLFPNPTTGIFNLDMGKVEVFDVKIFNLSGQLLKTFTQQKSGSPVDITDMPNGNYIVNIEVNGEIIASGKIIKTN